MAFDYHRNKLRRHYEEAFDSAEYLDEYYNEEKPIPAWDLYILRKLEETFRKGFITGGDCLEVGCGPTVHHLAFASRVCDTLTFGDISEDSLEFLENYRTNSELPFKKFKHLFEHIAKLEGRENVSEGAISIESRLKVKIREVIRCDVLESKMLDSKDAKYDVILSSACIELASVTFDDFIQCTKNMTNYLKPGGYLILTGFMSGNFSNLPHLTFDLPLVNRSLRKAGLEIFDLDETLLEKDDDQTDDVKCFLGVGRKD